MSLPRFATSLSSKFLLIVLGGAILPLAVVGLWLAGNTQRSGEQLLHDRLDAGLLATARETGARWVWQRSALLDICDDTVIRHLLQTTGGNGLRHITLKNQQTAFTTLRNTAQLIFIRDKASHPLWLLAPGNTAEPILMAAADSLIVGPAGSATTLRVLLPIREQYGSAPIGWLDARFRSEALVPGNAGGAAAAGAVIGVVDRESGAVIVPLPFDPGLLAKDRFKWGNDEWLTARRTLADPAVELLAAAPLTAFTVPFAAAARKGLLALLATALFCILLASLLTRHVTRALVQLTKGAGAVAAGDLERTVDVRTHDEVGLLAASFNTMTESLRRSLAQLSQRQAVAAVGEFAAALAHEIRNPLSAIRVNLQHAHEQLADDRTSEPIAQSLRDIARLENTLAGALRVARTGRMQFSNINVVHVLEAAIRTARPELDGRVLTFESPSRDAIVRGNAAALEQLFLNLLLNAAHATPPDGHITVTVALTERAVRVSVADNGEGMAETVRARAFEPFYSTKPEGSGLGLSVAKRIVSAHGGTITVESELRKGAVMVVQIPASNVPAHAL